jgi:dienelactone hydrolase
MTIEKHDYQRTYYRRQDYFGTPFTGVRARPIQICIWYPALDQDESIKMTYGEYVFPNPEDNSFFDFVSTLQQRELGFLGALFANNTGGAIDAMSVETNAIKNAPPASGPFPIILYFPEIGFGYSSNMVMAEYLASMGYIVVSVHSYGTSSRNPEQNQADLEYFIRDMEFALAEVSQLEFSDSDKIGTMGVGFGGLAALILQMRNSDVGAVCSLEGWNILSERIDFVTGASHYSTLAMNVPLLQFLRGEDSLYNTLEVESYDYSVRYMAKFADAEMGCFTGYNGIRDYILDSVSLNPTISRPDYETGCHLIGEFFNAYLNQNETSLKLITEPSGELGINPDRLYIEIRERQTPPPQLDEFIPIVREHGAARAIEIYQQYDMADLENILPPEPTINILGYQLLQGGRIEDAVIMFRLNTEVHPDVPNCWDSYADGLQAAGDNEGALECYKKVLELLPADTTTYGELERILKNNAIDGLERLGN